MKGSGTCNQRGSLAIGNSVLNTTINPIQTEEQFKVLKAFPEGKVAYNKLDEIEGIEGYSPTINILMQRKIIERCILDNQITPAYKLTSLGKQLQKNFKTEPSKISFEESKELLKTIPDYEGEYDGDVGWEPEAISLLEVESSYEQGADDAQNYYKNWIEDILSRVE